MDLFSKRYTILVNDEPIELSIKNNKIRNAYFMDNRMTIELSEDIIKQIQTYPSTVINADKFDGNAEFTKAISKMMSQQLDLAILRNDKTTLSRFARSGLVGDDKTADFLQSINNPTGARKLLINTVDKTNTIFKVLKLDRFLDKLKEKIADTKADAFLQAFQQDQFNKSVGYDSKLHLNKQLDTELVTLASNFLKNHNIEVFDAEKVEDKQSEELFMQTALRNGFLVDDAKIAFHQTLEKNQISKYGTIEDNLNLIEKLKDNISFLEKQDAMKNKSLKDFSTISQDMTPVEKIDVLVKNEEYLNMNEAQKLRIENDVIYDDVPITDEYLNNIDTSSADMYVGGYQEFNYNDDRLKQSKSNQHQTNQSL